MILECWVDVLLLTKVYLIYNVVLISALQQCFSYMYTHTHTHTVFHYGLSQDTEYTLLCYPAESWCLSNSHSNPSHPLAHHMSLLYDCESVFLFHR